MATPPTNHTATDASHSTSMALTVIMSEDLFQYILSFIPGVPVWTVEYEHDHGPANSSLSCGARIKASMGIPGLLPQLAIQHGDIRALKRLYKLHGQPQFKRKGKFWFTRAMRDAAACGNPTVLQWLLDSTAPKYHAFDVKAAIENGHADAVRWLLEHRPIETLEPLHHTMDRAAAHGHLDVMRVLLEFGMPCSAQAMDSAAASGHLDIVLYLHELGSPCTVAAADKAAKNGHLAVLQWLFNNRLEGATDEAMHGAVASGHMDIVQFLWDERRRFDGRDLETSIKNGMKAAMPYVLRTASTAILLFVYGIVPEAFPPYALSHVAAAGNLDAAKFLYATGRPRQDVDQALLASSKKQPEIAEFLLTNDSFSDAILQAALSTGGYPANRNDPGARTRVLDNKRRLADFEKRLRAETLAEQTQHLQQLLDRLRVQGSDRTELAVNCFWIPTPNAGSSRLRQSKLIKRAVRASRPRSRPRALQTIGQVQ